MERFENKKRSEIFFPKHDVIIFNESSNLSKIFKRVIDRYCSLFFIFFFLLIFFFFLKKKQNFKIQIYLFLFKQFFLIFYFWNIEIKRKQKKSRNSINSDFSASPVASFMIISDFISSFISKPVWQGPILFKSLS